MRFSSSLFPLAALLCACDALPTSSVILEKIDGTPAGWTLDQSAELDRDATTLTLKIHLVNQGMDKFQKLAMDVGQLFLETESLTAD